jgi:hypothetical protein
MRKESEGPVQPGQPALVVTYGNTTRKHRPLDRDVLVLGRAPSCDVGLVSPEVAPVHCIILRTANGWRIRDCSGGRHATRVNGRTIHEELLHDADVVQIGTFTFEVQLPVAPCTSAGDGRPDARVSHLLRSRRNLVRLALRLRQRARKGKSVPPTLAELERRAQCLRDLQRQCEALASEYASRLDEVEQAEREVCDQREALEQEYLERRTLLEKAEHEIVRQQAEKTVPCDQARVGNVRDRLSDFIRLKQELAGSSPSAPGDQLRPAGDRVHVSRET